MPSVGLHAEIACIWEATARKAGNVHRYRDFADALYPDFLVSAALVGRVLDTAAREPVGQTILRAIRATRGLVPTNTNLGIVLVLAPLAAVPPGEALRCGVERLLAASTVDDSRAVYEAIRLARPGGLGTAPAQDVRAEPTATLREVMALAAGRDLVARQYANGFQEVFESAEALRLTLEKARSLEEAVVTVHLALMARHADTLIARKRGALEAAESARRAAQVLAAGWPTAGGGWDEFGHFDAWLRAEGNARNPGATADLVAASLFAALREGIMALPPPLPWSVSASHGWPI